ncbi:MAG TPA: choice-of-anchor P family protein [Ktedonobacteraceae bacterium]|nr:choice-of-anchor P family protein [Ktedonobacteraceae bacterium]
MVKRLIIALIALSALLPSTVAVANAASAIPRSSLFPGVPNAYGYAVYVLAPSGSGGTSYGPSVPVGLSCTTPPGTNSITNSGPALPADPLILSGTANASITLNRTQGSLTIQTSEDIHNLSLLGGVIAANDIHALVTSTSSPAGASSTNSSTFSGLMVNGTPENNNPAPNTKLSLPGLGSVILNEQSGPFNGSNSTSIGVVAMDIQISSSNSLGIATGTRIVLAFVQSAIAPAAVTATTYGLYGLGLGGSTPNVGPGAVAGISCKGGSSSSSSSGISSSAIGSTGTEASSASGQLTSSSAVASSQNSISNLNLLSGLVSANKVTTLANASWNSSGSSSRSGSATFQNASVDGTALPTNPAPNTRENLPGIGYALINEQSGSNDSSGANETVIAIDIYVTVANNSLGLPVGARIIVSLASAGASSY